MKNNFADKLFDIANKYNVSTNENFDLMNVIRWNNFGIDRRKMTIREFGYELSDGMTLLRMEKMEQIYL